MKKKLFTALAGLMIVASFHPETDYVVAEETQAESGQEQESSIVVEGLSDHYHTGDEVQLVASLQGDTQVGNWQWYIRSNADAEWTAVEGLTTQIFSREATTNGQQIKVALLEDNGNLIQESEAVEVSIDDHHSGDENAERIYSGFFYNDEVADRELSDWEGDWQSVYPNLVSGDLDVVFEDKASHSNSMTAEEYKDYYTVGYETDVDRVVIEGDSFTFYYADGTEVSSPYEYDGSEVLTYERGNRGVRFVFRRADDNSDMPEYIQFSDHSINPTDSAHYHLYWGDDREELLAEVEHWPTYYPSELDTEGLVHDMLAH